MITPNSIEAYYNGNYIGIVNKTRTVSDFGKDLVAYLGKSTYNDIFYKGGIKEVKVYANALTQGGGQQGIRGGADPYGCGRSGAE